MLGRPENHPYRTPATPWLHDDVQHVNVDPAARRRRLGVALGLAAFVVLVGVVPLCVLSFAFVTPGVAGTCSLGGLFVQVLLALSSAHLLFAARENDRTRGQTLCASLGTAVVVIAVLGVVAAAAGTLLAVFLASLGPWCGVCGT